MDSPNNPRYCLLRLLNLEGLVNVRRVLRLLNLEGLVNVRRQTFAYSTLTIFRVAEAVAVSTR